MTKSEKNAKRQREYKARMAEAGFVQINVWVRPSQASKLQLLAQAMRENEDLAAGPATNVVTGRMVAYDR
jgi:hypothetical protein